jgi:hypothetical protein
MVELLRFVCLEMSKISWRERLEAWNSRFPEWQYSSREAFVTAVHDAEHSLTGDRHGLAWFYDAKAKLGREELKALARQGDPAAQREADRRREQGFASMQEAGIKVQFERKKKRDGKEESQ